MDIVRVISVINILLTQTVFTEASLSYSIGCMIILSVVKF